MKATWANKVCDLQRLGWTLKALSETIGLSPQGLCDLKKGRTRAPGGMAAVRLHHLWSVGKKPDCLPAAHRQARPRGR